MHWAQEFVPPFVFGVLHLYISGVHADKRGVWGQQGFVLKGLSVCVFWLLEEKEGGGALGWGWVSRGSQCVRVSMGVLTSSQHLPMCI